MMIIERRCDMKKLPILSANMGCSWLSAKNWRHARWSKSPGVRTVLLPLHSQIITIRCSRTGVLTTANGDESNGSKRITELTLSYPFGMVATNSGIWASLI
jgi:hypothetical protein